MLLELRVKNLALIEKAEVEFGVWGYKKYLFESSFIF